MKTYTMLSGSKAVRTIKGVVATLGLVAATAAFGADPVGKVGVLFSREQLGSGIEIHRTSNGKRIVASPEYTYDLTGNCRGKLGTALGQLYPKEIPIAELLESISKGSSKLLHGTFADTTGVRPLRVLDETISGSRIIKGIKVKVSFMIVGQILANGECALDVTNVKISAKPKPSLKIGSMVFKSSPRLVISAAPIIGFKKLNTNVIENAGTVVVSVVRDSNRHGPASVKYSTVAGTANSSHYTPVIDGIVNFADGDTQKDITIQILNNTISDSNRTFTIQLSEPGNGALLGSQTSTSVTIMNDGD